jgi:hypothetical protein
MVDEIKDQLTAFLTGFYDVIPPKCLKYIDEKELGLILAGQSNIDGKYYLLKKNYQLK